MYQPADARPDQRAIGDQPCPRHAGVSHDTGQAPVMRPAAAIQFQPEHQHGKLGLGIDGPGVIAIRVVEVVEADTTLPMGDAGDLNHPGAAGPQQWQQSRAHGEMAEVVGGQLHLETVFSLTARRQGHDTRIVDQNVDGAPLGQQPLCKGRDRGLARQVQLLKPQTGVGMLRLDIRYGGDRPLVAAGCDDDVGSAGGQSLGRFEARTAVGASHYGAAAGEVGDVVSREGGHDPHVVRTWEPDKCGGLFGRHV